MPSLDDDSSLEKAQRAVYIAYLVLGMAVTVWYMYELEKDDPFGWPAQLRHWWEERQRRAALKRRELVDAGNLVVEAAIFLEKMREARGDG